MIHRGLSKGIEKFCTWAMPATAICALIVLVSLAGKRWKAEDKGNLGLDGARAPARTGCYNAPCRSSPAPDLPIS